MARFEFVNARGDSISLSANKDFFLTHIDGQTSATSSVSSNVIGGVDGDTVSNMQAEPRPLVFDLRIRSGVDVEEAKRRILRVIKLKQNGTTVKTEIVAGITTFMTMAYILAVNPNILGAAGIAGEGAGEVGGPDHGLAETHEVCAKLTHFLG